MTRARTNLTIRRWTKEGIIADLRALAVDGMGPTSLAMGMSMTNACIRHFGSLRNAHQAAGLRTSRGGRKPAGFILEPAPPPPPPPPAKPDTFTSEPVVSEYQAHLARQRKRLAEEAERIARQRELYGEPRKRRGRHSRSDFYGRVKWDKGADYLPPPDLLHFRGAA